MALTEAEVHRKVTDAWIRSKPIVVELVREQYADDGAGGTVKTGEITLQPQTFRIDMSTNQSVQFVTTSAGTQVPERFRIVGYPGADIKDNDKFKIDDVAFDVTHVHMITFERVAAEVERRG